MTPRQTFELIDRLQRQSKAVSGSGGGEGDEDDGDGEPADTPDPGPRLQGAQGVKGMGLDKYRCWAPQDGEMDGDPFTVSRDVARDRTWAMILEWCKKGLLESQGVPKDDLAKARDLFDKVWRQNSEKYQQLTMAFVMPEADGRALLLEINRRSDYVARCGKIEAGNDEAASAWFDVIRQRHAERFAQLRAEMEAKHGPYPGGTGQAGGPEQAG